VRSNLKEMRIRLSERLRKGSAPPSLEDPPKAGGVGPRCDHIHTHTTGLIEAIVKAQLQHNTTPSLPPSVDEATAVVADDKGSCGKQAGSEVFSPPDDGDDEVAGASPNLGTLSKLDPSAAEAGFGTSGSVYGGHAAAPIRQALKALGRTQFKRQDWSKGRTKEQR